MTPTTNLISGDYLFIKSPNAITPPATPVCTHSTKGNLTCYTLNKDTYILLNFTNTAGTPMSIQINGFTNPSSLRPSDSFTIRYLDTSLEKINLLSTSLTVTNTAPGSLLNSSIVSENYNALQQTSFTFFFKNAHKIPINGTIVIVYPTQIQSYGSLTCSANIGTANSCSLNTTS